MEFIGPDLRADKTLFAWAGAPHGAISTMLCSTMRLPTAAKYVCKRVGMP